MTTELSASWQRQQPHTKAIVYFISGPGQDGRTFFARELYFNRPVANPRQYGIEGLKRMIDKWGPQLVASALIIDLERNEEIHKFLSNKGWVV
ncbi:hypothetical protein [Hymenobacter negativus]|uniref:Uncharacterized protein n=1 Tax=Hymenobacter negativus TaxID=2795026 RepID=A0ABS3Q8K5_9BACT|nr:hypothetical protein [Hymenobacter negativus]MBO2007575.1 hypothetical protein [Hymenobacter negativus]